MNQYIDQLNTYLTEHPPNYGGFDLHSLLEFLWYHYSIYNPVDTEAIRKSIDNLNPIMESLSIPHSDMLFDTISDLCLETEQTAFLEGLHVGIRLAMELCAM